MGFWGAYRVSSRYDGHDSYLHYKYIYLSVLVHCQTSLGPVRGGISRLALRPIEARERAHANSNLNFDID
jgi:hypothetical protein